jgi:hypothetical protein
MMPHPIDTYNVTALLTAAKFMIVRLETWYCRHCNEDDKQILAWFPSIVLDSSLMHCLQIAKSPIREGEQHQGRGHTAITVAHNTITIVPTPFTPSSSLEGKSGRTDKEKMVEVGWWFWTGVPVLLPLAAMLQR